MPTTLSYGTSERCVLENIDAVHLRPRDQKTLSPEEIVERVKSQLDDPLHYPPLSQAMIPEDEIVVAVEPGIPQLPHVLEGALQALEAAAANPTQITVLLPGSTQPSSAPALNEHLNQPHRQGITVEIHDPDDEKSIAFLGVSETGLAIRLNRHLCDADFVLPIGSTRCYRVESQVPCSHSELYPCFSDRENLNRLANQSAANYPAIGEAVEQEIQDCQRQLGTQLKLQVVPHGNSQIADVLAGEVNSVRQSAETSYSGIWWQAAPLRSSLVIATINGDEQFQTWHSLGRAIAAATPLLADEGSLVIYSELATPPAEAIGHLAGNEDPMVVEREILKTQSADCGPAIILNHALQRGSVYLRSRLRSTVVESLGITPLESDSELERLAQTLGSCLVLEEAQYMLASVAESDDDE